MDNPYQVLGVDEFTSEADIRNAYRTLARRWHPDRFPEGPERLWAEDKMIKINLAYEELLSKRPAAVNNVPESEDFAEKEEPDALLSDVRSLMALGQLDHARRALMRADGRDAEWNYLFGAILLRRGEYDKAILYFGISARLRPESAQYRAALRSAEALREKARKPYWQQGLEKLVGRASRRLHSR